MKWWKIEAQYYNEDWSKPGPEGVWVNCNFEIEAATAEEAVAKADAEYGDLHSKHRAIEVSK